MNFNIIYSQNLIDFLNYLIRCTELMPNKKERFSIMGLGAVDFYTENCKTEEIEHIKEIYKNFCSKLDGIEI